MISIIVPSINPAALERFRVNVEESIGEKFEIINYDNSQDGFGICQIYNICAKKANFPNLVFCHDDILFRTKNWGEELIKILSNNNIGLVGITGATYKSKYPASWVSIPTTYYRSNLWRREFNNSSQESATKVAVIDGCFMAMRKNIWEIYQFDELNLKGFHLYDIDTSVRILRSYDVVVSTKIQIEHLSEGNFDSTWYTESKEYHKKKPYLFPASANGEKVLPNLDAHALRSLIFRSSALNLPKWEIFRLVLILFVTYPQFLSYRMLRLIIK